jgi:hypothetical protein
VGGNDGGAVDGAPVCPGSTVGYDVEGFAELVGYSVGIDDGN